MDREPNRLALLLGSLLFVWLVSPPASWATAIPSKVEAAPARGDVNRVNDLVARERVARALAERGLASDEVRQRLAQLSEEDVRSLAIDLEQIQAAGDVPHYIWILLGILLALIILAKIL